MHLLLNSRHIDQLMHQLYRWDEAGFNFKIQTNQRLSKTKDFKTPAEDTKKKVLAFQTYLKGEIIKTQQLKLTNSIDNNQK